MKTVLASTGLMAATASAVTLVGNGVPLIYADKPYPNTIYNGVQYNATVINGVAYNASNEWPCLDAKGYESIVPACSVNCVVTALSTDDCDVDDFVCHCTQLSSEKLDASIKPCLTTGDTATCTSEEIGELINFVHGSLCPYFEAVTDAYDNCSTTTTSKPSTTLASASDKPSTFLGTGSGKPTTSIWTTVDKTWTTVCAGPTTFAVGSKTWTVDSATTLVVSDWARTVTSTSTWLSPVATGAVYQNGSAALTSAGKVTATSSSDPVSTAVATGAASNVRVGAGVAAVAVGVIAMML